ncbi:RNA polymerase sigma 70 [Rathayibacter toxicus]|uniref:RNA polymerase sigma 70 n=1 Tax=Rathayibacter toxicus TaxID=145458 RepID=A0A0C5BFX8_9MICO|nr:RNA polymerase sigma 70 [Rathayibacter toxicus]KKM46429.1 RNA polymerase sigma 70 [Rathayibacter toxicus]
MTRRSVPGLEAASDALLAGRSAEGDVRAFEVLVKRHHSILRAYAWRLTGSSTDASDAVQNALITVWARLPQLKEPASVRSWMMRIVSRASVDLLRQRHPTDDVDALEHPVAREPGPCESVEQSHAMEALAAALAQLPESQRQCWLLREVGGESYGGIAEHLRLTPTAVRGKLARARESLVAAMEDWR